MFSKKTWKRKMNKYRSTIGTIGAILLLAGAIIQITRLMWAPYLYLAGAILFAYTQITDRYELCLTIAAVLELYTAFRIPQEMEKE